MAVPGEARVVMRKDHKPELSDRFAGAFLQQTTDSTVENLSVVMWENIGNVIRETLCGGGWK